VCARQKKVCKKKFASSFRFSTLIHSIPFWKNVFNESKFRSLLAASAAAAAAAAALLKTVDCSVMRHEQTQAGRPASAAAQLPSSSSSSSSGLELNPTACTNLCLLVNRCCSSSSSRRRRRLGAFLGAAVSPFQERRVRDDGWTRVLFAPKRGAGTKPGVGHLGNNKVQFTA
jgi:hypothetical protein